MPNIYYFHGLNGFLTQDKRMILEPFGKVIAPTYNFQDQKTLFSIKDAFTNNDLADSIFIGNSFGGYVASYLSAVYDKPTLFFNPALMLRKENIGLDAPLTSNLKSLSFFVLGEKDPLLPYQDNLDFIHQHIKGPKEIATEKEMAHFISAPVFKKYVTRFFELIEET